MTKATTHERNKLQWRWSIEVTCMDTRSVWSFAGHTEFWVQRGSENRVHSVQLKQSQTGTDGLFTTDRVLLKSKERWMKTILFRDTCQYKTSLKSIVNNRGEFTDGALHW